MTRRTLLMIISYSRMDFFMKKFIFNNIFLINREEFLYDFIFLKQSSMRLIKLSGLSII